MTTNAASLIAAATSAALAITQTKSAGREATEAAFRASAESTLVALEGKVSAVRLAEAYKAAGVKGLTSDPAVGFHSLTGQFLRLADADWDGSGQSIQTAVKKIGQAKAKAILKKAESIDDAVEALATAVGEIAFDCDKALAALLKAAQRLEEARVSGAAFDKQDDAALALDSLASALINIRAGKSADLKVA